MAQQLYTIPINEAFDEYDGCPLCRLRAKLENQSLSYIMGAAMMEPDIRIVTNRTGFCRTHFHRMLTMGNRLSLALMLESHLDSVAALVPEPESKKPGKLGKIKKYDGETPAEALMAQTKSCFVCQRAADFEKKYVSNVIYIFKKEQEFREKLKKQPYFCMEHTAMLLDCGKKELSEALYLELSEALLELYRTYVARLRKNVTGFCRSFDHENAGKPLTTETRYAVEDTIAFLSGDFERKS
ncbi:MAG: DUF6062 family protein [Oscillospiraceae bacterium]|nr:DUF6062 family protein [Oscillospiraceae bacterium]